MSRVKDFIESGILELYAMGRTTAAQSDEVERMAAAHPEVQSEIDDIRRALETFALNHAVDPDPLIKPLLMGTLNYMNRLENGEPMSFPPEVHQHSTIDEYAAWLNRKDLNPPEPLEEIHVRIIGYSPETTIAIVWLKDGAPAETHHDELETFLIVEGSCDIFVDGDPRSLKPGDVYNIPLHKPHWVTVTSDVPCKVILQRKKAA